MERSITDDLEEVQLAIRGNDVTLKAGSSTIYSRQVEGRFPRYSDVIPSHSEHTIDMVVSPFYAAIRQAQIVTNEESRGVDFAFTKGQLTLKSLVAEIGQSTVELPISYEGDDLTITFDPRFVAEFLRILSPETNIQLRLVDSESAAVLSTEDDYTYVIMPLSRDR
jgi:DNA polymerase-3 subunit beta